MLLQNYFSLVPSDAYTSIGDISLYDHTKTTVAIAVALYQTNVLTNHSIQSPTAEICKEKISLIAGDFPSIQKYLFGNIKKNAELAKRLRAKSLTVQLMNEAVIEFLLEKLELPRANVLINAGGKFVIMSPQREKEEIDEFAKKINAFLIDKYEGNIKFIITKQDYKFSEVFEVEGGTNQSIGEVFAQVFDSLTLKKWQTYDQNQLSSLSQSKEPNGKVVCKYCGLYSDTDEENETADAICEKCKKEKKLGEKIVGEWKTGVWLQFSQEDEFCFDIRGDQESQLFVQFNDWNVGGENLMITKSINVYVPTGKTFEDLASSKRKYLCMLKGDIDMMSIILKHGFGQIYSVSRLVQFSRMLELFFGKYIHEFLARSFPDVYTVFSGGDDFVFIVPFVDRFKFISSLYEEFGKFVAGNEKIHFSVGLSIFKDKTPFSSVNEQTEELLKHAKQFTKLAFTQLSDQGKDILKGLPYRGLCIYEEDFIFRKNNSVDIINLLQKEITIGWGEESVDNERNTISETMLYTMYLTLKKMQTVIKQAEVNRAEYLHLGSRILYMINKNLTGKLKQQVLDTLLPIITRPQLKDGKLDRTELGKLIFKIVDHIYTSRA